MENIYVGNKKGTEVNLTVGRNYSIIYMKDGVQVEASGEILNISNDIINLGYTTVKIDSIEDIKDITKE